MEGRQLLENWLEREQERLEITLEKIAYITGRLATYPEVVEPPLVVERIIVNE